MAMTLRESGGPGSSELLASVLSPGVRSQLLPPKSLKTLGKMNAQFKHLLDVVGCGLSASEFRCKKMIEICALAMLKPAQAARIWRL